MGRFLTRRDADSQLGHEENTRKAVERAEMMATSELLTWCEAVSSTIAVQVGSYAAHQVDDTQLHEARRQTEVLHGLLSVLINRS
jgi:hypothetical protein